MLKAGKLDSELLKRAVFDKIRFKRPEVITRPGIGRDCAEIDFGEYICTLSTDPVTASVKDIGRLSVHISCNDIASNGIEPVGILLSVLLPLGTTEDDVERIMEQAAEAAEKLEVEIIGGHTEITGAVSRPVITSTAIGRAPAAGKKEELREGDILLMTGRAGMEGTGIIVREREEDMKAFLSPEEIEEAKSMLDRVSVVREGVIAGGIGFSAMHDVTEGGVLGAVWEICSEGGMGAAVNSRDIPVAEVTVRICGELGLDWMRLISSGAMIIAAGPEKAAEMEKSMPDIARIGYITAAEEGIKLDGKDIEPPGSDEIYRAV